MRAKVRLAAEINSEVYRFKMPDNERKAPGVYRNGINSSLNSVEKWTLTILKVVEVEQEICIAPALQYR